MFPRKSVKVPVVKLKSGLVKKDVTFPATNKCLWDPVQQGSIIPIHFAHYRNPQIQLTERAVLLANRHASQSQEKIYRCFLVGHCLLNTDEEGITLVIDRFDPGSTKPGRTAFVPTTLLPGDFAVPLTISQNSPDQFPTHSSQDILHSAKLIEHLVCSKEKLALDTLLPLRAHCTCYDHHDHVTVVLTISCVTVSNGYQLSSVSAVPILPTALARNLSGPLSLSEIQKTHKMGYMTMDQTRKLLLMIESDPKISTLPIVGLWLSGILSVYSPHAWAACLRFMHNNSIQQRVLSESGCFLVVLYSPTSTQPLFYQCHPLEDDVCFQLFECNENLHCIKNSKKSPVLLEMSPAQDGPQQATFLDAMQKFKPQRSSSKTPSSRSSKSRPLTIGEIEEPKPLPSPKPLLHQNASMTPSVPELSVLFDSFDESIPNNPPIQSHHISCTSEQPNKHISPHPYMQQHHPTHSHSPSGHPYGQVVGSGYPYQSGQHRMTPPVAGRGMPIYNTPQASTSMTGRGAPLKYSHASAPLAGRGTPLTNSPQAIPSMTARGTPLTNSPQANAPFAGRGMQLTKSHGSGAGQGMLISNTPHQYTHANGREMPITDTPHAPVAGRGIPITDTPHHPLMDMKSKMTLGRSPSISHPVHQCHPAPVMNTGVPGMGSQNHGNLPTSRPDNRRMSDQNCNKMPFKGHRRMSAPSTIDCPCPHQGCMHSSHSPASGLPLNESNHPMSASIRHHDGTQAFVSQSNMPVSHPVTPSTVESHYLNRNESYGGSHNHIQSSEHQRGFEQHPVETLSSSTIHNESYTPSSGQHEHPKQHLPPPVQKNGDSGCSYQHHTPEGCGTHPRYQNYPHSQDRNQPPGQHGQERNQPPGQHGLERNQPPGHPSGPDEHTLQQLKRQEQLIKDLQAQVQSLLLAQAATQIQTPLTPPATPVIEPQHQSTTKPDVVAKKMCNMSVNTGASLCWRNEDNRTSPVREGVFEKPKSQSRNDSVETTLTEVSSEGLTSGLTSSGREHQTYQIETSNKHERQHHIPMPENRIRNGDDLSARESSATSLDDTLPDPQIQNDTRSLASSVVAVDLQSFNGSEQVTTPQRGGVILTNSVLSPVLGESASMLVQKPDTFVEGSMAPQTDSLLYKDETKFYNNLLGKVKQMLQGSEATEASNKREADQLDSADDDEEEDGTEEDDDEEEEDGEEEENILPLTGQSMYLSMDEFPRINYVSMVDMSLDSTNLSMEANAIAMKYLSDQELTALSEAFRTTTNSRSRTAMLNKLADNDDVDVGSGVNMSMASKKYMEKYGLLDTSVNLNTDRGNRDGAVNMSMASMKYLEKYGLLENQENKKDGKAKGKKKIKKKVKDKKVEKRKHVETIEDDYSVMGQDKMVEPFQFPQYNRGQTPATPKPILVFGNRKRDFQNSPAKNISWNIGNASSPRTPLQTITNKGEQGNQGQKADSAVKNILDIDRLKQLPKLL